MALLSCLCLAASSLPAAAAEPGSAVLEGFVVGVSDGARLMVSSAGNPVCVKLYGVAAPQLTQIDKFTGLYKAGQPYAEEAFHALSVKVLHQQVKVDIRRILSFKEEPKQVAIGVVYLDGRNINMEMLLEGWGWAFTKFTNRMDTAHYLAAERLARARRNGLWMQDNPEPPWIFKPQLKVKVRHS